MHLDLVSFKWHATPNLTGTTLGWGNLSFGYKVLYSTVEKFKYFGNQTLLFTIYMIHQFGFYVQRCRDSCALKEMTPSQTILVMSIDNGRKDVGSSRKHANSSGNSPVLVSQDVFIVPK